MGNSLSISKYNSKQIIPANFDILDTNMPPYYTEIQTTHKDYINANYSWKLITDGKGKHFLRMHKTLQNKKINKCIVWFYDVLYSKLFEELPEVKPLFNHNIDKQGRMLITMISLILNSYYDKSTNKNIEELAKRHAVYGAKIYYFYVMGEVLLYSLKYVLQEEFTDEYYIAWQRIYSELLRIVIPILKEKETNNIMNNIHASRDKMISSNGGKYSDMEVSNGCKNHYIYHQSFTEDGRARNCSKISDITNDS